MVKNRIMEVSSEVVIDGVSYGFSPICLIMEHDISNQFKKEHLQNSRGTYKVSPFNGNTEETNLHLINIRDK